MVIPIGYVAPGTKESGVGTLSLRPGIDRRQDEVTIRLRANQRKALEVGEETLTVESTSTPKIRIDAQLLPFTDGQHLARLTVHNLEHHQITGMEIHFGFPGEVDVELLDRAARAAVLGSKSSAIFDLAVQLGPDAPAKLPLQVVVDTERFGQIARWPMALPTDGQLISLTAPTIDIRTQALRAPVGQWSMPLRVLDDDGIQYVTVFANNEKIGWAGGQGNRVDFKANVELMAGLNRLVVITEDTAGVRTTTKKVIWGEPPLSADAHD
jgi:hypothetical protein